MRLKLGLVDKVGNLYDAQKLLFEKAEILEPIWLEKDKDEIEMYLEKIFGKQICRSGIEKGIAKGIKRD